MDPILSLMRDLEQSIPHASTESREATVRRVTDLLVANAERLSEEQVAIFDGVITRLLPAIRRDARAELARRLASLEKAPSKTVRSLAQDEIAIARPILAHSPRLSESDLAAIAIAQGSDHRRAIAERRHVPETVAEILVARGDHPVSQARARRADGDRRERRRDFAAGALRRPRDRERASGHRRPDSTTAAPQRRVEQAPAGGTFDRSGAARALDYRDALDTIGAIALLRPVDEEDVAGFAEQNRLEEVICAIAASAALSLSAAEDLFTVADANLILILGKAKGWSWETLRSLLGLRDPDALLPSNAKRFAETFEDLDAVAAERILHVVTERGHPAAREGAAVRPVGT
jgi:Uncharacterised protein conserved in bacteria (DUF2336)